MTESQGRASATQGATGAGDILLAVARQERQRSEIQAKLNAILDSLRPSPDAGRHPALETAAAPTRMEPAAAVRARAIELFAEDVMEAPVSARRREPLLEGPTASLKARLDTLVALENAMSVRAELRGGAVDLSEAAPAPAPAQAEPAVDIPAVDRAMSPTVPETAVAHPGEPPAWQAQIDRLNERLERIEAASIIAATTLDSLITSFDTSQQNTFAAAQAGAREEVRSAIAAEIDPAMAELRGAASSAHEEIHGVLTMLGTCLERVVGHLQKIESVSGGAAPAADPPRPFEFGGPAAEPSPGDPAGVVEAPALVAPGPAVPLPGFGRRSKLAALIDFGFGTRAA